MRGNISAVVQLICHTSVWEKLQFSLFLAATSDKSINLCHNKGGLENPITLMSTSADKLTDPYAAMLCCVDHIQINPVWLWRKVIKRWEKWTESERWMCIYVISFLPNLEGPYNKQGHREKYVSTHYVVLKKSDMTLVSVMVCVCSEKLQQNFDSLRN